MAFGDLLKKAKDLVIESEEPATTTAVQAPPDPAPQPAPVHLNRVVNMTATTSATKAATAKATAIVDQAIVDQIMANVGQGTSAAYQRFCEQLELLSMVPEGHVRTQAACASAKVKPADIIAELDRRLTAADGELQKVEAAAEDARQHAVGGLEQQIAGIDQDIGVKTEQVKNLEEQIRLLRENMQEQEGRKAQLAAQIPGEEAKIANGLNKFRQAHSYVRAQLDSERTTIAGMLNASPAAH